MMVYNVLEFIIVTYINYLLIMIYLLLTIKYVSDELVNSLLLMDFFFWQNKQLFFLNEKN